MPYCYSILATGTHMSAGLVCVFVARSPSLNRMEREQYQAKRKKGWLMGQVGQRWPRVAKSRMHKLLLAIWTSQDPICSVQGYLGRLHRRVLVFIYPNRALVTIGLGPVAAIG